MKRTLFRIAAVGAAALVLLPAWGAEEGVANDPYWATCEQLADREVMREVAKELADGADMPVYGPRRVAERIGSICAAETRHYRPGGDAIRATQSAALHP